MTGPHLRLLAIGQRLPIRHSGVAFHFDNQTIPKLTIGRIIVSDDLLLSIACLDDLKVDSLFTVDQLLQGRLAESMADDGRDGAAGPCIELNIDAGCIKWISVL